MRITPDKLGTLMKVTQLICMWSLTHDSSSHAVELGCIASNSDCLGCATAAKNFIAHFYTASDSGNPVLEHTLTFTWMPAPSSALKVCPPGIDPVLFPQSLVFQLSVEVRIDGPTCGQALVNKWRKESMDSWQVWNVSWGSCCSVLHLTYRPSTFPCGHALGSVQAFTFFGGDPLSLCVRSLSWVSAPFVLDCCG